MKHVKRFNEKFEHNSVYTEIENDFSKEIADSINYNVVDILNSIPNIHWTIESRIDESKIDGSEGWLDFFDSPGSCEKLL